MEKKRAEIIMIAVVGRDGELGRDGDLLWHLPGDLRHFKATTLGAPVIMGRVTWESLHVRPLPKRLNIVLTRRGDYDLCVPAEKRALAVTAGDLDEALRIAGEACEDKIFIIGGASLYAEGMAYADKLILTEVDASAPEADVRFPVISPEEWRLEERTESVEENGVRYWFATYVRVERSCE